MEIKLSDVISLIAAAVAAYSLWQTKKNNVTNIKARYYTKIFDSYLIEKIPRARRYIRFGLSDGKMRDCNKLSDVLQDMMRDALYFQYSNIDFYKELRKKVTELDDYINEMSNKSFVDYERIEVEKNIQEKLASIYTCIEQSSVGQ